MSGEMDVSRHRRTPLFEALLEYHRVSKANFHVPGHKQGRAFSEQGKKWFSNILTLDLTEVGNLDDLHDPSGVIAEAQELAAAAFHADQTLFLVGGTTAGNIAAILHLCQPGDTLIVQRNCHQSVFHACYLAGIHAVYLQTDIDVATGLELPIQPAEVKRLLDQYPHAKGVFITSPSYYGMVQPIRQITEICHHFDVPLLVDEAHGAHFGFHPSLPLSAMQLGADLSVQSTHKMLGSMTMSSMLHIQGERVQGGEVVRWLRMLESSSPSYPLMASLDLARAYIVNEGQQVIDQVLHHLDHFRAKIQSLSYLYEVKMPRAQDPFKFSLKTDEQVTGFELARWLEERGIYTELADYEKVLFVFSLGTTEAELQTLWKQLVELDKVLVRLPQEKVSTIPVFPKSASSERSFHEIRTGTREIVPLIEAEGRISTEMIIPYPPGIPVILPGERFTKASIDYLIEVIRVGGKVRGLIQSSSYQVYVINDTTNK